MVMYGFSATTGVVGTVVKGLPPALEQWDPGAPSQPTKTMFHTPPDHVDILVFRAMNCCCDPATTVPSTCELPM